MGHEASNHIEDHPETRVVLLLECFELLGQLGIGGHYPTDSDERPHDANVDLNGPFAAQNTGQHRDAMFREDVGRVAASTASLLNI